MKIINGYLILTEDTIINEDLTVIGDIEGDYNLTVKGNINCFNINCRNIDCNNINCFNINCMNIDCRNIDYFAVCFVKQTFKCKSVKGRREKSKHFCLDNEIEYKIKVCNKCGSELK